MGQIIQTKGISGFWYFDGHFFLSLPKLFDNLSKGTSCEFSEAKDSPTFFLHVSLSDSECFVAFCQSEILCFLKSCILTLITEVFATAVSVPLFLTLLTLSPQ